MYKSLRSGELGGGGCEKLCNIGYIITYFTNVSLFLPFWEKNETQLFYFLKNHLMKVFNCMISLCEVYMSLHIETF